MESTNTTTDNRTGVTREVQPLGNDEVEVRFEDTNQDRNQYLTVNYRLDESNPADPYGFGSLSMSGLHTRVYTNKGGFTQTSVHCNGYGDEPVAVRAEHSVVDSGARHVPVTHLEFKLDDGIRHTVSFFGVTRDEVIRALQNSAEY